MVTARTAEEDGPFGEGKHTDEDVDKDKDRVAVEVEAEFKVGSRSRSRFGVNQCPRVGASSIIIIITNAINQSINRLIIQSPSSLLSTGLVIPYFHSNPRAQAGAVRILPVSSILYFQTAIK